MKEGLYSRIQDKIQRAISFPQLQREIEQAPPLDDFGFLKEDPDSLMVNSMDGIVPVGELEPDSNVAFELSLRTESQQYALLGGLQRLGFDVFLVGSMPKGEKFCVGHDNLPKLESYLLNGNIPGHTRFKALANKLFSPVSVSKGRLHIRFYHHTTDPLKLVTTAHVDPPKIEHLAIHRHIRDSIVVDYQTGEGLFERVLGLLGGVSEMPEVDSWMDENN